MNVAFQSGSQVQLQSHVDFRDGSGRAEKNTRTNVRYTRTSWKQRGSVSIVPESLARNRCMPRLSSSLAWIFQPYGLTVALPWRG